MDSVVWFWRRLAVGGLGGAAFSLLVCLGLFVSGASADVDVCSLGGVAGEAGACSEPKGVAVDSQDGLLYVADSGNNRVDVFDVGSGDFLLAFGWGVRSGAGAAQTCGPAATPPSTSCQTGLAGSGAGQLNEPKGIAVDNDATSAAFHDIYVFDGPNKRIERFHPSGEFVLSIGSAGGGAGQFESIRGLEVGLGGLVEVIDTAPAGSCPFGGDQFSKRVQKFTPAGALAEAPTPLTGTPCGQVQAFALDSSGDFYVGSDDVVGVIRKYHPDGTPFGSPYPINPSSNIRALAVNTAGDLFVGDNSERTTAIYRYGPAGALARVFYGDGTMQSSPISLAPFSNGDGDVFAASGGVEGKVTHVAEPPPGPVIFSFKSSSRAGSPPFAPEGEISNTKASLAAEINPEGKAATYHFEYVDEKTCEDDVTAEGAGHCFDDAKRAPAEAAEDQTVGSDFTLHLKKEEIGCPDPLNEAGEPESKCLSPKTRYRWRAFAINADGEGNGPVEGEPFETKPPLEFGQIFSIKVGTVEARLHGEVNPLGVPATGWFEYVDDATFNESGFEEATKIPNIAEEAPLDFGAAEGLIPGVVQLGSLTPGTTYHYRLAAVDPLIEPLFSEARTFTTFAKPPTPPPCANDGFRTGASAVLPDCRAYELVSPVEKNGGDIVPLGDADLTQGAADGQSITYAAYRSFAKAQSAPFVSQYLARRGEAGWENEAISPPREGQSFYDDLPLITSPYKLFSDDLCSGWVLSETEPVLAEGGLAGYPNLYRRDNCGAAAGSFEALTPTVPAEGDPNQFIPKPQAFSADGKYTVFTEEGKLNPTSEGGVICTKAQAESCTRQLYISHGGEVPQPVCILPDGAAITDPCSAGLVRALDGGVNERSDDAYQALSADGSRVFWTDSANGSSPGALYVRINPAQEQSLVEGGKCSEPAKACTLLISAAAAHFRSAAAEGSVVIYTVGTNLFEFDVDKALAEEAGASTLIAEGVRNVLGASRDASRTYFVSTKALSGEEANSQGDKAKANQPNLFLYTAGAGGGSTTFVGTLAGADKAADTDQPPRSRTSRVSPGGGDLAFVSQAPMTGYDNTDAVSGKTDDEVFLYDAGEAKLRCISCNPSGARPVGRDLNEVGQIEDWVAGQIPGWTNGARFSHILSNDGHRLFFEAADPLVLRDTNSTVDIYEWERAGGEEECEEAGAELFSKAAGGCISLISSGQSPSNSELIDAGTEGADVFFKTQASLLVQDPGLIDIYDARENGGLPPPPPPGEPCEGEACQSPPPPPEDSTPASSATEVNGNVREEGKAARRCGAGKRKVQRKGKVHCVSKHKRAQRHHRKAHRRRGGMAR